MSKNLTEHFNEFVKEYEYIRKLSPVVAYRVMPGEC